MHIVGARGLRALPQRDDRWQPVVGVQVGRRSNKAKASQDAAKTTGVTADSRDARARWCDHGPFPSRTAHALRNARRHLHRGIPLKRNGPSEQSEGPPQEMEIRERTLHNRERFYLATLQVCAYSIPYGVC